MTTGRNFPPTTWSRSTAPHWLTPASSPTLTAAATCRAQLIAIDEGDKYQIVCPECGEVSEHSVITNQQAEDADWNEIFGQMEINKAKPRRTEEEILKELGF